MNVNNKWKDGTSAAINPTGTHVVYRDQSGNAVSGVAYAVSGAVATVSILVPGGTVQRAIPISQLTAVESILPAKATPAAVATAKAAPVATAPASVTPAVSEPEKK